MADGHFSKVEREELIKIFPHDANERNKMELVIDDAEKDKNPIEFHAQRIKNYIYKDNKVFLEFIVAVLYKLAHVDHVFSIEEEKDIRKVAEIFEIKKPFLSRAFLFLKLKIGEFKNA